MIIYIPTHLTEIKIIDQLSKMLRSYSENYYEEIDLNDYLLYDKDVSATTRNNYRTWLSTFASWLVERQYIDNNFVENIKMVKET
jgi:site-specific recombinase XerD